MNVEEPEDVARSFVEELDLALPVLLDSQGSVSRLYTVMASEISSIMPGLRLRTSGTAICRKGSPPYRKITTAKNAPLNGMRHLA